MFALLVNKPFFGQRLTRTMMMLPYMVPSVVTIALWQWILAPSGITNYYLQSVGITNSNIEFFSSITWTMPSLVIASTWIYTSFAFFTILARLQGIPDSYYERAKVEGATQLQMFRDITLPNLRGVILLVALVRGIFLFNKFDIIYVATKGGPLGATTTLPIMIYEVIFMDYSLGRGTALAGILFVILSVGAVVYFRVFQPSKEVTA
jgi:multiple sugar transport system permease protein